MDINTLNNLKVFLGRVPVTGVLEAAALVQCAVEVDAVIAILSAPAPQPDPGERRPALSLVDRAA